MIPSIDFVAILLLIGVAQGLLLSLTLCTSAKGNVSAKRMLGSFVALSSYLIFNNFLVRTKYLIAVPHLAIVGGPLVFLVIVPLYFYVKMMTTERFSFSKNDIVHLIPFFAVIGLLFPFYLWSADEKIAYVYRSVIPLERKVRESAQLIQRLFYLYLSVRLILQHRKRIRDNYSSIEKINLRWLLLLLSATVIILAAGFVLGIIGISTSTSSVVPLILSVTIIGMGYYGLKQPEIFLHHEKGAEPETSSIKYETSPLSEEYTESIVRRLTEHMMSARPFTDPNLTLAALAKQLSVKPHHLSQILNEKVGKNFFEFINYYRIEEAKNRLHNISSKDFTLLSLAYEVGFNSKSVFNTAFKKNTGMTPSAYREQFLKS